MTEDKWFLWQRNVVERYKSWETEDIKADLKKNATPVGILMSQIEGDFNFSTVIRSANSFGVGEVFYYGRSRQFDKRGSCGTHHYNSPIHLATIEEVKKLKSHYIFVGLENNVPNTKSLFEFDYPAVPLIVVGEENAGIPKEILDLCDHVVEIPSRGSVRSLNAGCAASIVLYDYASKNRNHHTDHK